MLTGCSLPPNVILEIDDIEAEWCFDHSFDYIHCRYLAGSISDWPRLMEQAFKFTEPGGWVEFQDFDMKFYSADGTFVPGCATDEWAKEIVSGLEAMGREPEPGPKLEQWVRDAGFTNVNHQCLPIPVGRWPEGRRMVCSLGLPPQISTEATLLILTLKTESYWRPRSLHVSRGPRSHILACLDELARLVSRRGPRIFAFGP
jgi:hypothetical protein